MISKTKYLLPVLSILLITSYCVNSYCGEKSASQPHKSEFRNSPPKGLKSINKKGAAYTGKYQSLFCSLLNKSRKEVKAKINSAFLQLFYGNDSTERIYYPAGPDMAYIKDVNNNDVRTEGMTYGMMIALQMNKKKEFDRLWKWAKTYMQHKTGQGKDFFAWHCRTDGSVIDSNSASDGEEWFVTTLFLASARWGNGKGIYNYKAEARKILNAMLSKSDSSDRFDVVTNLFNKKEKKVVFVPAGNADHFTDPSYHLPHYYELWSVWADKDRDFWKSAANVSRDYFKTAADKETGLFPDYSTFDGKPFNPFGGGTDDSRFDSWRTIANIAIDYEWFAKDNWAVEECNRLLTFFYKQGIGKYGNQFTLNGKQLADDHSKGLVAMNAAACLAADVPFKKQFVEELWNAPIPEGLYRYYDGALYMMGLLQVSGNFRAFGLTASGK